jgi:CRP/FNR family nitrogen fixation transcriptional regulator
MEPQMTRANPQTDTHSARPTAALLGAFDRLGTRVCFAREEEIYGQEDGAEMFYRVIRGVVRTSKVTFDGRRQVGDFYYPGDLVGLEPGPLHRYAAEALTNCELQAVRRSALRAYAGEQEVDRAILQATAREMDRLQEHIMLLGRRSARERVATFLLTLAQRTPSGQVDMPMGRQDMADYLGLTIETVSRMLTQLQGESVVEFPSTRRFQVHKWNALEAMAA